MSPPNSSLYSRAPSKSNGEASACSRRVSHLDAEPTSFRERCLAWDEHVTNSLAVCANKESVLSRLRPLVWCLELSGTGYVSFGVSILLLLFSTSPPLQNLVINIVAAMLMDLVIIGTLKGVSRRPRPRLHHHGDMVGCYSVDKFSFPSGHASRAVMLTWLLYDHVPPAWYGGVLVVWCVLVCMSRLALGRHHASDVGAGIVVGCLEFLLVQHYWLPDNTCHVILHHLALS